ncbi:MAG: hypothetical protein M1818_007430 [Claussenomyces sp. TS43310]|nr:MAG: hypothetical protein M1818_007430 [Claussenomyces sp. TS43310]
MKHMKCHVRFNVNELARLAAEAVGAKSCISTLKYPDGMYNKAMLLTVNSGTQVVPKVPDPNAGKPHFTTASEVATMDFELLFPKVFAWSSKAQENSVRAKYIIMEKVPGIELDSVWPRSLDINFLQGIWRLYYAQDLDERTGNELLYADANGADVTDANFAIGPSTGRKLNDNGRATINFDTGPWETLEEYHTAIGLREIACIGQLSRLPKSPITLCGPGTYQPTRERKLDALNCYLKLIKFLLPTDRSIASSHLWHDDLHVANIFVNPSKHTEIVGLIDWQSTDLSPLYYHARRPYIIDYDIPPIYGLERLQLLKKHRTARRKRKEAGRGFNPRLYAALEFQQTTSYLLLLLARNLLVDGEASYLSQVTELEATWGTLPSAQNSAYPFSFSTQERQAMEADVEGASIGELFPEPGIVSADRYEEALDALEQMKDQVIEEFASSEQEREVWLKEWPFGA